MNPIQPKRNRLRSLIGPILLLAVGIVFVVVPIAYNLRAVREAESLRDQTDFVGQMLRPRLVIDEVKLRVTSVAITPDGSAILDCGSPLAATALTKTQPKFVAIHDAKSGKRLRWLRGLFGADSFLSVSDDGRHVLASGSSASSKHGQQHVIAQWDFESGKLASCLQGSLPHCYSPDGHRLGCANGVFDAATGKPICRINARTDKFCRPEFTPDGQSLALIGSAEPVNPPAPGKQARAAAQTSRAAMTLGLWNAATGKLIRTFPVSYVTDFDIAHNGQWAVVVSNVDKPAGGTVVNCVDLNSGAVNWTYQVTSTASPNPDIVSTAISPNGGYVVLLDKRNVPTVLAAMSGHKIFQSNPTGTDPSIVHETGLAFSADGGTLVSRCGTKVLVWDSSRLQ